ncbi:uncharacterized protein LOC118183291 isoform X2 [Stegodyphus dumicola]|uniref:uncharacterized protein LOC118183291 isoform X2 n=1 Tax=Stegodyphus dumicola TaxID=202533 RepID=UPI0015AF302A|nr:uncharacterized protein LOC118183291 isoform X2 [Stegodyphus dumicola]
MVFKVRKGRFLDKCTSHRATEDKAKVNMDSDTKMRSFNQNIIYIISACLFSSALQVQAWYGDEDVERGDEFIDKLLKDMLEDHGHEYDPYLLEDNVIAFSKKITFVNVTGEAKLHNGYILGLKTLHRPDHCYVTEKDGRLHVKADLGAGVLDFRYDGTVKFMNFGPTIHVFGSLAYLEVHMEFSVDSKTGRDGELTEFYIDDIKGMKVWVTGLGPLNWSLNYIISGVTTLFEGYIRSFIQNKVRKHLEERLPNYVFPVDGAETLW